LHELGNKGTVEQLDTPHPQPWWTYTKHTHTNKHTQTHPTHALEHRLPQTPGPSCVLTVLTPPPPQPWCSCEASAEGVPSFLWRSAFSASRMCTRSNKPHTQLWICWSSWSRSTISLFRCVMWSSSMRFSTYLWPLQRQRGHSVLRFAQ